MILPPSLVAVLPEDAELPAGARLVVGAERVPPEIVERWSSHLHVVGAYGLTETDGQLDALARRSRAGAATPSRSGGRTPTPRPTCSTTPLAAAAAGRAGRAVRRRRRSRAGYLGRPDLTAERFVADPFGAAGRAAVPDRRPRPLAPRRDARVRRPRRPAGEDPRRPDRAGRDRVRAGPPSGRRARGRRRPRGPARRPAPRRLRHPGRRRQRVARTSAAMSTSGARSTDHEYTRSRPPCTSRTTSPPGEQLRRRADRAGEHASTGATTRSRGSAPATATRRALPGSSSSASVPACCWRAWRRTARPTGARTSPLP